MVERRSDLKFLKAETKKQRIRNILLLTCAILLAGGAFAVVAYLGFGIPCFFHLITKLNCPGCGNTRAVLSLLKLDFVSAFKYNMMFLPEVLYLVWVYALASFRYIKDGRFSYKPPFIALDITLLVLIVLWGIVRNIFGI